MPTGYQALTAGNSNTSKSYHNSMSALMPYVCLADHVLQI